MLHTSPLSRELQLDEMECLGPTRLIKVSALKVIRDILEWFLFLPLRFVVWLLPPEKFL